MTTVECSIVINATPEAIDKVALDGKRLSEWYAGIESAEADSAYPQVGGVVEAVYKAVGMSFKIKIKAIELDLGKAMTTQMEGMITGTTRWVYGPAEEGTQVTSTLDYELPGGGLGQMANKLVIEKMNASNLEKSLSNLKALVEGG